MMVEAVSWRYSIELLLASRAMLLSVKDLRHPSIGEKNGL